MSYENAVTIDIDHAGASWIGPHRLAPPTTYWPKAVASALRGLGVPRTARLTVRRLGNPIRFVALEFLDREKATTTAAAPKRVRTSKSASPEADHNAAPLRSN
jgi:hypothetical protein